MLVVRVELHSAITGQVTELGAMIIANDSLGTREVADYNVRLGRKGTLQLEDIYNQPVRSGRVVGHRRLTQSVWALVGKAIRSVGF